MMKFLSKLSKINEFKTYMIDKKFANDLIRILQNIEDQLYSHAAIKKITNEKKLVLLHTKQYMFQIFINLCDHDVGIVNPENNSQEHGYLLENIPSISEIQDMLKTILLDINFPPEFMHKLEEMGQGDMVEEKDEYQDKITEASIKLIHLALQIVEKLSKNIVGQYILLYTEYSKTVRNPNPITSFSDLFANLIKIISSLTFKDETLELLFIQIAETFVYSIYSLTFNPLNRNLLANDKRKAAIKALLSKSSKVVKLSSPSQQAITITESFEGLVEALQNKKKELIAQKGKNVSQLKHFGQIFSTIELILFQITCINNFVNANVEPKKDEKLYLDMDNPKDIDQKFKEVEEKESAKPKNTLLVSRRSANSPNKFSSQTMNLIDRGLDDLLTKANQPLTAWKKQRLFNIARDQLGLQENRISHFFYSHLYDFEVTHWDYDGNIAYNKNKLEVYYALRKLFTSKGHKIYRRDEFAKRVLLDLFGSNTIFGKYSKQPYLSFRKTWI